MLAAAYYYDVIFCDSPVRPQYAEQVLDIFLNGVLSTTGRDRPWPDVDHLLDQPPSGRGGPAAADQAVEAARRAVVLMRVWADALIDQFRIRHVADKKAGELSYGQQKLVDIAMAFMSQPDLVLLDEPCAGVNPSLVGGISTLLKQLNQNPQIGKHSSFVVIEHNMDFVMDLCHRIMVMVEGRVMAIGTPAEIRSNKQVLEAYLGS